MRILIGYLSFTAPDKTHRESLDMFKRDLTNNYPATITCVQLIKAQISFFGERGDKLDSKSKSNKA